MVIGIDASRAFLRKRTGIEEYSYRVIEELRGPLAEEEVVLYMRPDQDPDFALPAAWRLRKLGAPRFWTQGRLSLEMLLHPPDVLFIPAHTVPLIHPARNATFLYGRIASCVRKVAHWFSHCTSEHSVAGGPKRTAVTMHGLEYEFCPQAYAWFERWYMRLSIRFSCRTAETIISVSENTKQDLMRTYAVPEKKIRVVHEGYATGISNREYRISSKIQQKPYLLFVGRLEERKNIVRIIQAFEILKEKYQIPHTLVLAGKPGYGYEKIRINIQHSIFNIHIRELGYVTEEEKWELLRNADVFLFPTLYEGFGIPVLEAQSAGVPVVLSETSSLPEVGGAGGAYCDPWNAESIAEQVQKVLSDQVFRDGILERARENVGRFSWKTCAESIAGLLRSDPNHTSL